MKTHEPVMSPADFSPLLILGAEADSVCAASDGNLWLDVWCNLRGNVTAMLGMAIIALLLLFAVLGEMLWSVNPAALDMLQISQAPFSRVTTRVVDDSAFVPVIAPPVGDFSVLLSPNTESVVLAWRAQAGQRYRVYRHEWLPSGVLDLGMPLMDMSVSQEASDHTYVDQLLLENRRYYYSLAILNAAGETAAYQILAIDVEHATAASVLRAARLLGNAEIVPSSVLLPSHPFGTDKLGRDILARLVEGGKTSLLIGFTAPIIFVFFGALYGAIAGFRGGMVDTAMMAFADFVMALPFLLFMILLRIAFGIGPGGDYSMDNGMSALLFALVILSWPNTARLVRAQVLQLRSQAYVESARLQGASALYIAWRHLLPNVLPSLLVALSFAIPSAIFTEAFLSFIGLGVVPPAASWGSMCNDGLPGLLTHPHELLLPAGFISLTVLAFNLFGDGLRDALDVQGRDSRV